MATKKKVSNKAEEKEPVIEQPEVIEQVEETTPEAPETKEEEVVMRHQLGGVPETKKVKLVAKQVFEPMTLTHKTVWEKVEE